MTLPACSDPGGMARDLYVAVVVADSAVSHTDTIELKTLVTNISTRAISIQWNGCNAHYELIDPAGRVVGPRAMHPCLSVLEFARLRPGESHLFDYKLHFNPGMYRIRGVARTADRNYHSDPVEILVD